MYRDIPLFLGHCMVGFPFCYLLITVYELAYVFAANTLIYSNHDYWQVFNGWLSHPDTNVKIELNILFPVLETLIFQVLIVWVLQKSTKNPFIIIGFVSVLFTLEHTLYSSMLNAFGAGIASLGLTYLYIRSKNQIGVFLSASATAISYALLSTALVRL
ncbi:CPBP family glutamic-type intramembrane protease [Pseudoteredinibacter isoporae]|uniref:CAAX prenyl protease 2/Lysostaphin resistance protein A-like domain-containing protein n=1 Tax=Pseudoteredinibacter isoporae TaxID=570281 RepID=A0A7X0MVH4_9GAMM|nr:CPBP family glutamic-type intramembrane protease [Pseudoteredinibacter isoporae]MBB6521115.1 hypothetical protein [Pseudoteredinibacter isoporae]NHO86678.1 CPBP family intramembrane metalloprotease [Pseudoteredinibacter isoporae]NIB24870.1 CPBP family intramembrane metalloprotease [Pseudoteredinibacter isoporae]